MTSYAFFLILISVVLHASWHFMSKSRHPAPGFFLLLSSSSMCGTMIPMLSADLAFGQLPWTFYGCVFGGGTLGALHFIGLSIAYRNSAVSFAYPLARAVPVLMTAGVTALFGIGEPLGAMVLAGMGMVFVGCMLMPLKSFREYRPSDFFNRATWGIALAACAVTGYTVVDSIGIGILNGHSQAGRLLNGLAYTNIRELFIILALTIFIFSQKRERMEMNRKLFCQYQPYLGGIFAGAAYALVIVALGETTNAGYVQAFRQMSLPIGVLLGIFILKEKCTKPEIIGLLVLFAGLIVVAVGS